MVKMVIATIVKRRAKIKLLGSGLGRIKEIYNVGIEIIGDTTHTSAIM